MNYKIDNLQYCKWSREVFEINREAGLDAVHVTVVYHEDFQEFKNRVDEWNLHFKNNSDLILLGKTYKDIEIAKKENKTAIFFGFQNCSPIEDDINLDEFTAYFLSLYNSFAAISKHIEISVPALKPALSIAFKINSIASSLFDNEGANPPSVSYTHLTLPTSDLV